MERLKLNNIGFIDENNQKKQKLKMIKQKLKYLKTQNEKLKCKNTVNFVLIYQILTCRMAVFNFNLVASVALIT